MVYTEKIRKKPESSLTYKSDDYFHSHAKKTSDENKKFVLGCKLILVKMLAILVWIVWGVTQRDYHIPEIASRFFVMGLIAGITVVLFKLDGMKINDIASSFQSGAADLVGTAIVVGMAKGALLVLGGSDAPVPSALNAILRGIETALTDVPTAIGTQAMYIFQSLFSLVVTSNSGQAALTIPIMAPLVDLVDVSRQVAVPAHQLGSGFVGAFTSVSASLIGVLGVARIEWAEWARFQIKIQGFLFVLETIFIMIAIAIGLQQYWRHK